MKKLIAFLCLVLTGQFLFAQAPQATSYQAVIRNSSGNVLSNQLVKVRFSIRDSSVNGTIVYSETQTPTTNAQGLINLFAGQGAAITGSFTGINWGNKSKYLQTEIDITGGSNYTDMGTTQLMSVPYALYANTAANGMPAGTSTGDILYWNGTTWVKVAPGTYGQSLIMCNGVPTWGGCLPIITTRAPFFIDTTFASAGGNLTSDGGSPITAKGICWSTSSNPTIALPTKTVNAPQVGEFLTSIEGLTSNTTYYVRAYATNNNGTAYGNQQVFTTRSTPVEFVSNTLIGNVAWSNSNLSVTRYRNGDLIPQVTNGAQWASLTTGAWCWYDNDSARYAATYGRLYNWYAVNDPRGLAPQGWRIPSLGDWNKMIKYLDSNADTTCINCTPSLVAGGMLKSTEDWYPPNTGATNSSLFNGKPGGTRASNGTAFLGFGYSGQWWTTTTFGPVGALRVLLYNSNSHISIANYDKPNGFSVRVVRD